jgi:hypothetical protein
LIQPVLALIVSDNFNLAFTFDQETSRTLVMQTAVPEPASFIRAYRHMSSLVNEFKTLAAERAKEQMLSASGYCIQLTVTAARDTKEDGV